MSIDNLVIAGNNRVTELANAMQPVNVEKQSEDLYICECQVVSVSGDLATVKEVLADGTLGVQLYKIDRAETADVGNLVLVYVNAKARTGVLLGMAYVNGILY